MRNPRLLRAATYALVSLAVSVACGGSTTGATTTAEDTSSSSGGSSSSGASSGATSSSSGGSSTSGSSSGTADAGKSPAFQLDPALVASASCSAPVPPGAPTAAALPKYAGTCPAFAAAGTPTTITTSGTQRQFLVYAPQTIAPGEKLPVVFLWHWLGGSADGMASTIDVTTVVEERRIIAVIPSAKGDTLFKWPFENGQSQARVDEELAFFDDMLACVAAALPVNKECVSSMGVSAGALWTAQVASARSERLASFVSLSGGTGGLIRPWSPVTHSMPALVLWGGPTDMFPSTQTPLLDFQKASKNLEDGLAPEDHFLLECVHNCGHAVPPLDPPPDGTPRFDMVWQFVLAHPFWLGAGQSPMTGKALPSPTYPTWCAIGQGKATPRAADAPCP